MKLNIQLFASLNVGDTYETTPIDIKPYGYNANHYQMKFTVKLNSQNLTNFTSNITITSYMRTTGASWGWSGFSKIYMERYTKANDEAGYTLRNNTQIKSLPTDNANVWVNCGSWSGDIQHKSNGTCTLYVKNHLLTSTSSSYSYIPRDTEQESEVLTLHQLHTAPSLNISSITETNTYLGVSNDVFVQNLSRKSYAFTPILYDSATATNVTISNGSTTSNTNTTSPKILDFTNKTLYTSADVLPIKAVIKDSLNSTGEVLINYSASTKCIFYTKPTINTSTSVKRNGQLSGKVLLNLYATYYNGTIGSTTNTITVQYKFWEKDTTEPSSWNDINNPTISGNNITVSNYEIGSNNTSASNYFNPQKAYNVKIYIKDAMRNYSGTYMGDTITKTIPLGESVWDEYKDRLKIKKIETTSTIDSQNHKALTLGESSNGSNYPQYFLLAKLPPTSNSNGATLSINGSLGGHGSEQKSNINVVIANRDGLNTFGSYIGTPYALNKSNIQIYQESDGKHAIYFVKNAKYTGGCYLNVYGTNLYSLDCETEETTPSGTLVKTLDNSTLNNINLPVVLYDNTEGANGTITLSDSSANYSYIEILYKSVDDYFGSVKVPSPNGKKVALMSNYVNNTGNSQLKIANKLISGTSISNISFTTYGVLQISTSLSRSADDRIYITRVLGYY